MDRNEVLERVRKVVENAGPIGGTPTDNQALFYNAETETNTAAVARGCYGLDSLDRVEVAINLEEEFGIDVSDADAERFGSIAEIADAVAAKLA